MATTGTFTGTNLMVLVDGEPIGHTTSCTIDLQHALADASSKDSAGWAESISGRRSGTVSFEGLVDYADDGTTAQGLGSLISEGILNRKKFSLVYGTQETGDTVYSADAFLAQISSSAPDEETVTYSGSFTITGEITESVNV